MLKKISSCHMPHLGKIHSLMNKMNEAVKIKTVN